MKRTNNKMKSCLVHRASTSDEELQNHLVSRLSEQPTHGILKAPSGMKHRCVFYFIKIV